MRTHHYNCIKCGEADTLTEKSYQHLSSKLTWHCPNCRTSLALEIQYPIRRNVGWLVLYSLFYTITFTNLDRDFSKDHGYWILVGYLALALAIQILATWKRTLKLNNNRKLSKFDKEELSDTQL